jgi:beta-aspartyl-dipeptidase (metallo-type)
VTQVQSMILFERCELFAPESLGRRDVLLAGTRVAAIGATLTVPGDWPVDVVDAKGLRMIPGLIDAHVHIAGGGGEGGPATRTPELRLGQLRDGAITTVIGCLGTDGFTRDVASLVMKAKALRAEGVSCWTYTGSYQVPPPTLLGDVARDLALVDEIIGVGEIALADHRSSGPTVAELIRIAGHARVGGMLGGKAGIVHCHMGDAKDPFRLLYQVIEQSELKFTQFWPTHCNRNSWILDDSKSYGKYGPVDITTSSYEFYQDKHIKPSAAAHALVEAGVPLQHVTMTSDGCGSLPMYDPDGNLERLFSGEPKSLLKEVLDLQRMPGWSLERALRVATTNVADVLKLPRKGRIRVGDDADVALLDQDGAIRHLVALGEFLVRDGVVVRKGTFEV